MIGFIKTNFCLPNKTNINNIATVHRVQWVASVQAIPIASWNMVLQDAQLFLSLPYLTALEKALPKGVHPMYAIVYENEQPVFITYLHLYTFTKEQLSALNRTKEDGAWLKQKTKEFFFNILVKYIQYKKLQLLVLGNILQTGSYSFASNNTKQNANYIQTVLNAIKKEKKVDAIILKDFEQDTLLQQKIEEQHFLPLYTQPNMMLSILPQWKSIEAYKNTLHSKYRKRMQSAQKKMGHIVRKELTENDLFQLENKIYALFEEVYEHSEYRINKIKPNYFYILQQQFLNNFKVIGYYDKEELIGFASYFVAHHTMEANYIGMNYEYNSTIKLYQNILYDYTQWAIEQNCHTLYLSRTGLEIKSTIGAVPVNLYNFIQLNNKWMHRLLKPVFKNLQQEPFVQRHPFKEE